MRKAIHFATILVLMTGTAQADNFANIDLRSVESQQNCMAQARQALVILAAENGSNNRSRFTMTGSSEYLAASRKSTLMRTTCVSRVFWR